MPKIFGRELSWAILGPASLLGLYVVYTQIFPPAEENRAVAPHKKTTKTADKNSPFVDNDYKAKFAVFTEAPKNSFQPLVVKTMPTGPTLPTGPDGKPIVPPGINTSMTGGEEGWGYTGYVVLNGRPQALIENPSKGEALYVQKGDVWKRSTVAEITPEAITLRGAGGTQKVKLGDISEPKKGSSVVASGAGVAPVNPAAALRGAIGSGLPGIQGNGAPGTPGNDASVQNNNPFNDLSVQPDQGFGRRGRGGRRNRGGGGFPNP